MTPAPPPRGRPRSSRASSSTARMRARKLATVSRSTGQHQQQRHAELPVQDQQHPGHAGQRQHVGRGVDERAGEQRAHLVDVPGQAGGQLTGRRPLVVARAAAAAGGRTGACGWRRPPARRRRSGCSSRAAPTSESRMAMPASATTTRTRTLLHVLAGRVAAGQQHLVEEVLQRPRLEQRDPRPGDGEQPGQHAAGPLRLAGTVRRSAGSPGRSSPGWRSRPPGRGGPGRALSGAGSAHRYPPPRSVLDRALPRRRASPARTTSRCTGRTTSR